MITLQNLPFLVSKRNIFPSAQPKPIESWCEQKGYCEINPCIAAMPSKAKRKEIMNAKRGRRKLQVLTLA